LIDRERQRDKRNDGKRFDGERNDFGLHRPARRSGLLMPDPFAQVCTSAPVHQPRLEPWPSPPPPCALLLLCVHAPRHAQASALRLIARTNPRAISTRTPTRSKGNVARRGPGIFRAWRVFQPSHPTGSCLAPTWARSAGTVQGGKPTLSPRLVLLASHKLHSVSGEPGSQIVAWRGVAWLAVAP
jgi:hypothetical protein